MKPTAEADSNGSHAQTPPLPVFKRCHRQQAAYLHADIVGRQLARQAKVANFYRVAGPQQAISRRQVKMQVPEIREVCHAAANLGR